MENMTTLHRLGEISRIMADGFHFVNLRFLLEGLEEDESKVELLKIVERFYLLCKFVEKMRKE